MIKTKIIKNTAGIFRITWDEKRKEYVVWELNADGQPFIFLGRYYYLETVEDKLRELDEQVKNLLRC